MHVITLLSNVPVTSLWPLKRGVCVQKSGRHSSECVIFQFCGCVCDISDVLIVVLSELGGRKKEKPAAEKRKIGCDVKRDSWELKERIRRGGTETDSRTDVKKLNQSRELRQVNTLHPEQT